MRWPDPALLHRNATEYISTYESRVAREKAELAETANQPDDEGWITVHRGSKKSVATTTLAKTTQLNPRERRRLKKQQREKVLRVWECIEVSIFPSPACAVSYYLQLWLKCYEYGFGFMAWASGKQIALT